MTHKQARVTQVRRPNEVMPAVVSATPTTLKRVIELQADERTAGLESTTRYLNIDWKAGVIPGVPHPRVAADGTIIDPDRQRPYSLGEVAVLCALPEVIEGVKAAREELALFEAGQRKEARVAQLVVARAIKQARVERERCPLLHAQVEALIPAIQWLVERSFDECPFSVQRVMPEIPETDDKEGGAHEDHD